MQCYINKYPHRLYRNNNNSNKNAGTHIQRRNIKTLQPSVCDYLNEPPVDLRPCLLPSGLPLSVLIIIFGKKMQRPYLTVFQYVTSYCCPHALPSLYVVSGISNSLSYLLIKDEEKRIGLLNMLEVVKDKDKDKD